MFMIFLALKENKKFLVRTEITEQHSGNHPIPWYTCSLPTSFKNINVTFSSDFRKFVCRVTSSIFHNIQRSFCFNKKIFSKFGSDIESFFFETKWYFIISRLNVFSLSAAFWNICFRMTSNYWLVKY